MISLAPFDPDQRLRLLDGSLHAAGLALALALAATFHFLAIRPLWEERRAAAQEAADLASKVRQLPAVSREHARLRQALAKHEQLRAALRRQVPDQPDEAGFLVQITRLAATCELQLQDYRPAAPRQAPTHTETAIDLVATGSYASLCRFLAGLGDLQRSSGISRLDIAPAPEPDSYRARMTLLIYSQGKW